MDQIPSARRTSLRSAFATGCCLWYLRFRFFDLCSSKWLFHALARISLPVLVTRIRLAMPLRVLSLGTGRSLLPGGGRRALSARGKDHEQVLAFEQRLALDNREWARVISDPVEDSPPDVLMHHLAAAEHDRHLYFFACLEELLQTLELGLEIVLGHLGPQLHLLELDDVLLAPLVLLALDGLELEASVVHQPRDRRARLWRHLNEVESLLAGDAQSGVQGNYPELVVLVIDQPHFGAADLIVDP